MLFSEDCARFGDQLARLVDAGVPVKVAAVAVGLSRDRCYAILRAIGRPVGQARGPGTRVDRDSVPWIGGLRILRGSRLVINELL